MHHFQDETDGRTSIALSGELWIALHALDGQSAWLIDDAEQNRAGLRVGTAITPKERPTSW